MHKTHAGFFQSNTLSVKVASLCNQALWGETTAFSTKYQENNAFPRVLKTVILHSKN